jgi:hypothetical protein
VFGIASALFAAKSVHGVAPRVDADPVEVKIGQIVFEQIFQTKLNRNCVSPFARPVAFEDALPIVSPLAET